ncbi:MAG TPA: hypothetical protein VF899_13150 [Pyrinomonadaceae bacterium]
MEDRKKDETADKDEGKELLAERKSEATSDETLSDLEDTESELGSTTAELDPGPSPDGLLDEPDEVKDAGPM